MNTPRMIANMSMLAMGLAVAVFAHAQSPGGFSLTAATVAGGGGSSSGGALTVRGTFGQPDASAGVMSGGAFIVAGGFWPGNTPLPPTCVGDIASPHNGMVDIDDLVLVITSWGPGGGDGPADLNHDHIVNIDDLVLVITHWGMCP